MTEHDLSYQPDDTPRMEKLRRIAVYLFAAAALVWVFHDIRFGGLVDSMRTVAWGWAALAVVLDFVSYIVQGVRWRLLLSTVGKLSVVRAVQAVYVGLFTSEIVPMRLGELTRAFLVSQRLDVDFDSVFPSIAVERLCDGIWLSILTGVLMVFVPLPEAIMRAADILGCVVIVCTGLFIYLVIRRREKPVMPDRQRPSLHRPVLLIRSLIARFAWGIHTIGFSRSLFGAFFLSLLYPALQILAFWFMMVACGLDITVWEGSVVALIIIIGTAVPNAPSNVGSFQFFCVVGLTLFGVDKTTAAGFSLISFAFLTIPLWVLGFIALASSGSTLSRIRKELLLLRNRDNVSAPVS